jgi:hypothetical protein
MMRDAGAREVHMRIASPPTRHSCFYGVDTPERAKLLAAQMNVDQMRDYINADSLAFISIEGLYRALGDCDRDLADALAIGEVEGGDGRRSATLVDSLLDFLQRRRGSGDKDHVSARCSQRLRGGGADAARRTSY